MSIKPDYRTIQDLLQSRSFSIDEYQREYKWERSNIEELITDLQAKFQLYYREGHEPEEAAKYGDYFLGSIIVTQRGTRSYLVDGQQRVTSLTLLLIYLYRESTARELEVTSTLRPLIFSDSYGKKKFNLDITERVPVIKALFEGSDYDASGKDESIKNIVARYADIVDLELAAELGSGLEIFIYWLINNVGLIEIATTSDADAYSIFETMNDRGKPLSPVDMLKAYLLGAIEDQEERADANRVWKKTVLDLISWGEEPDSERDGTFVKAWLRAKYAESTRDRRAGAIDRDWELIGSGFHRWVRENQLRIGVGDSNRNLNLIANEMPFFARAYRLILEASRSYTRGLEPVFYNSHNDFTWQSTVLMAPLNVGDDDAIVRRKIAATAKYLDIWIMRRTVNYIRVGYSSVSYAMWSLCRDIRGKTLPDLIDTLRSRLDAEEKEIAFEGSPRRGRHGIEGLRLNQFSRRYIYHLLARVTAYVEKESGRGDPFPDLVDRSRKNPVDIEHIWAQNHERYVDECPTLQEFEEWRDHVGGLLLLPADVNRSYQDQPFENKAPHYAKQNLYAASLTESAYQHQPQFISFIERERLPFRPYERFLKDEQRERRKLVLELAHRVWDPESIEQYR